MSACARADDMTKCCLRVVGVRWAAQVFHFAFFASFEVNFRVQDAPRASRANSDLLAMTRLARPNKLNSCASFLASPL